MKVSRRILVLTVLIGVCTAVLTGLVENTPGGVTIPENKYYGFPLIWRINDPFTGEKFFYLEFFVDVVFWTAIYAILVLLMKVLGLF